MTERKSMKVKTFTTELRIFKTIKELKGLDEEVNRFLKKTGVKRIISVSDTSTTDDTGATIGLIRVLAYET